MPREDLSDLLAYLAAARERSFTKPSAFGLPLYYPSRRQSSPAFTLLVDALRYRS
jgi:LysR family transcriptional regulator, regulator of peptidoglycan recycling